jgi:hypothetical protein
MRKKNKQKQQRVLTLNLSLWFEEAKTIRAGIHKILCIICHCIIKQCFSVKIKYISEVFKVIHRLITTISLKLNEIIIGNYLQGLMIDRAS